MKEKQEYIVYIYIVYCTDLIVCAKWMDWIIRVVSEKKLYLKALILIVILYFLIFIKLI